MKCNHRKYEYLYRSQSSAVSYSEKKIHLYGTERENPREKKNIAKHNGKIRFEYLLNIDDGGIFILIRKDSIRERHRAPAYAYTFKDNAI